MPEILIYDDIGADMFGDGVSAASIKAQLDQMDGDITVRINSYGGDVFEGHAIYNLIKHYEGKTTVLIDGIAASAASVVAMAGDEVFMPVNAMMMIHDPYTVAIGNAEEMTKTAEILEQIKGTIINVYSERVDIDKDELSAMMTEETWLDAAEADRRGFASMDEDRKVVLNQIPARQWINHAPPVIDPEPEPTPRPNHTARQRYLEILADAS